MTVLRDEFPKTSVSKLLQLDCKQVLRRPSEPAAFYEHYKGTVIQKTRLFPQSGIRIVALWKVEM